MSWRLGRRERATRGGAGCAAGCIVLLLCGLWLTGCGFEPLLARGGDVHASDELGRINVLTIPDRSGQILRNQLLDDLAAPVRNSNRSLYSLEVKLAEPRQEIAIRRDESASRVAYTAHATFALRDSQGRLLFSGLSSSTSTFEATTSEFASIAGQRSARDRAMQEISADIRQQLASYFVRARRTSEGGTGPSSR